MHLNRERVGCAVRIEDFDYHLPREMIAQEGAEPRDSARLMVLREGGGTDHRVMRDLPSLLERGDVLVANESRVLAARVPARKPTGGRAEVVFLEDLGDGRWDAIVGGGRLHEGSHLILDGGEGNHTIFLEEARGPGRYSVSIEGGQSPLEVMERWGEMPTPPYIRARLEDQGRYQTVYSRVNGSVAAPTAGLHFNDALLGALDSAGVSLVKLVLHVGYGTFQPVRVDEVEDHVMESERLEVSAGVAASINDALDGGRRVIAVGTTTIRALETATDGDGRLLPVSRSTDLFIYPGYEFRFPYSGLLTNFHLPRSTLLMLVSAYAGRERMLAAYGEAVGEGYRFYSLGDGMLIEGGPV
jgi:S-adenosylmethionine:tRNA ribosyltransferase-isomerase